MHIRNIIASSFITAYFFCVAALANPCPDIKDISIKCDGSKCQYSATTVEKGQKHEWKGHNKNPSKKLLKFINYNEVNNYCAYSFPQKNKKTLRLFPN